MKKNKRNLVVSSPSPTIRTPQPPDIIITQSRMFTFRIKDWVDAVKSADMWDMTQRSLLYDMYKSALLDTHLDGIIDKRRKSMSRIPIEFRRDGEPDQKVNDEIEAPWFRRFIKSVFDQTLYGFGAYQFFRNEKGLVDFYEIDHKHLNPFTKQILKFENDMSGPFLDDFQNTMFIGDPKDIGKLARCIPWILWKRNDMADWMQFCQVFGMPTREYTYDAGDEETRKRLVIDAQNQGSAAVYIHPESSKLNLLEAGNKTGSSDLYKTAKDACNAEMSICILGNTLTTESSKNGTQSLGKIHQNEEDDLKEDDRQDILEILNFNLKDIFINLGINVEGGKFVYAKERDINPSAQMDILVKANSIGVPIDDNYVYDTFSIQKPKDYDEIKKKQQDDVAEKKKIIAATIQSQQGDNQDSSDNKLKNILKSFFRSGTAPKIGANTLEW